MESTGLYQRLVCHRYIPGRIYGGLYIIAKSELPRLEQIFPQITSLVTNPIGDGDELDPGVTNSGSIVLLFPNTTQDKWNKKTSAVLTINLHEHVAQTVKLP